MKIKLKSDKFMGNYYGMNDQAGKALRFKHTPPKGTLYIDKVLTKPEQAKVAIHEKIERYMMAKKHLTYNRAHKIANSFEMNAHVHGDNRASLKKWEKRNDV